MMVHPVKEVGMCADAQQLNGRREGFSLVEVVVAMVILAVVVMSLGMLTTVTAQRSIELANGTGREAFALQETNRLAAIPYASINAQAGCATVTMGQLSYQRCISVTQGNRYREITVIITPLKSGTFADTIVFRRVAEAAVNPLNLP
jgi:prepilin-type N-terminal cleavage/methylation domain-containing protein